MEYSYDFNQEPPKTVKCDLTEMERYYLGDPQYYFYVRKDKYDNSLWRVLLCKENEKEERVIYNEQLDWRKRQQLINYFEAKYILGFPNALRNIP